MAKDLQTIPEVERQISEVSSPQDGNVLRRRIKALLELGPKRLEKFEWAFDGAKAWCEASAKTGELWGEVDSKRPRGQNKSSQNFAKTISISDAGFADSQDATVCSRIAQLSPEERGTYYYDCRNSKKFPTINGLHTLWKKLFCVEAETPKLPEGKYTVIYADPPWQYDFSLTDNRMIENQYPTMDVDAICNTHDDEGRTINDIEADDCVLFLWATMPKLAEAMRVIDAWGFTYKTGAVWVKDKIGMGYYFRQQHELLLVASKGNPPIPEPENRPSSIIKAPRLEHSTKPESVYDTIDKMYPNIHKIELFGRNVIKRKNWTTWGNEA